VSRCWIGYLLSVEQSAPPAQLLFAQAPEDQGLLDQDGRPRLSEDGLPMLVAWSDNGAELTATDITQSMALMAIAEHHGRPGTPTDQAHVESLFSHLKGEWPLLTAIRDPDVLDQQLTRILRQTTRCACTPRSAASPPQTSTTAAGPIPAAPAPRGCGVHAPSGSSRIGGDTEDPRRADRPPRPSPLLRDGGCLREGVACRHGRRQNPSRKTTQPTGPTIRGRLGLIPTTGSIKGSETPQRSCLGEVAQRIEDC
jgi:hypothetical protein